MSGADTGYSEPEIDGMQEALETGMHLDDIDLGEDEPTGGGYEFGEVAAPEPDQIDRDAFWLVFQTAFQAPSFVVPAFAPLAIQPEEQPAGRAASDALYRLLEIYYPSALQPNSETFAQMMIAGPFVVGKVFVVRAILGEMKAARMQPPPQPANTNAAPTETDTRQNVQSAMSWMDAGEAA